MTTSTELLLERWNGVISAHQHGARDLHSRRDLHRLVKTRLGRAGTFSSNRTFGRRIEALYDNNSTKKLGTYSNVLKSQEDFISTGRLKSSTGDARGKLKKRALAHIRPS